MVLPLTASPSFAKIGTRIRSPFFGGVKVMTRWKRLIPFSDFTTKELRGILPLRREEDPPTLADQTLLAETVTKALRELSPRHRDVLILLYGLLGSHYHSAEESARVLGNYSREYVLACKYAALRRLRIVLLRSRVVKAPLPQMQPAPGKNCNKISGTVLALRC